MTYATRWHHFETFPTFTWLRNTWRADSPWGRTRPGLSYIKFWLKCGIFVMYRETFWQSFAANNFTRVAAYSYSTSVRSLGVPIKKKRPPRLSYRFEEWSTTTLGALVFKDGYDPCTKTIKRILVLWLEPWTICDVICEVCQKQQNRKGIFCLFVCLFAFFLNCFVLFFCLFVCLFVCFFVCGCVGWGCVCTRE